MFEAVFWVAFVLLFYTYFGYPALIGLMARRWGKEVRKGDETPAVSLIVPIYNGEAYLPQKIDNTLALDYPKERLQLLFVSDGSTDRTGELLEGARGQGIEPIVLPQRVGKSAAQNAALGRATGEILVFCDGAVYLRPDSLRKLVRNFSDPQVACVSGQDQSVSGEAGGTTESAGLYTRYEIRIRNWEMRISTLFVVGGCFYGVRRALREPLEPWQADDLLVPLRLAKRGYRVVCDDEAIAEVRRSKDMATEFRRRVRTFLNGINVFFVERDILNPVKFGLLAFQFWSHKLLRWLVPLLMVLLFFANAALLKRGGGYPVFFAGQIFFYSLAAAGLLATRKGWSLPAQRLFNVASFLCLVNSAIAVAWWQALGGRREATWEPTRR